MGNDEDDFLKVIRYLEPSLGLHLALVDFGTISEFAAVLLRSAAEFDELLEAGGSGEFPADGLVIEAVGRGLSHCQESYKVWRLEG